jgi:glucan-binding YG repeat protein
MDRMYYRDSDKRDVRKKINLWQAVLAISLVLLLAFTPGLAFATAGVPQAESDQEVASSVSSDVANPIEDENASLLVDDGEDSLSRQASEQDQEELDAIAETSIETSSEEEEGEGGDSPPIDNDKVILDNAFNEFLKAKPGVETKDEFNKALDVHDYLLEKAVYDPTSTKDTAIAILDNAGPAVKVSSKSFQAAFRELMVRLGVADVVDVSAGDQAWTLIKLGGQWTHIDAANDDLYASQGQGKYLFFGLTDNQIKLVHTQYVVGNYIATSSANNYYAKTHEAGGFLQAEDLATQIKENPPQNGGTAYYPIATESDANLQKLIAQQVVACLNGMTIVNDTKFSIEISGENYKVSALKVITEASFATIADQMYTGDSVRAILRPTDPNLKEGTGYTVSYRSQSNGATYGSSGPYNAGTYDIIITGTGGYTGSITRTFKITPAHVNSTFTKSFTSTVKYTGSPLTPTITLAYGNYTLTANDFTATYSNNVEPGYATLKVTGKGNFTGSKEITFKIEKDASSGSSGSSSGNDSSSNTTNGTTDSVNNGATNVTTQSTPSAPTVTGTWKKSSGKWWFQYDAATKKAQNNKSYPTSQWVKIKGKLYHFDSKGWMSSGWYKENNNWYYLGSDGAMKTGWQKVKGTWYYMASSGIMQTGKKIISGKTYYLNPTSGAMKTGWNKEGSIWYYYASSGAMKTGWLKLKGIWYYLAGNGAMQTGKYAVSGKTYYFNTSSGAMKTGWNKEGTTWYHYGSSGAMSKGWVKQGRNWYYLDTSTGAMKTGWQTVGSQTYFLNPPNGEMLTGWVKINGDGYYFSSSGAMTKNKWVGNYYLGSDGKLAINTWIGNYHVDANGKWDATR